MIPFNDFKKEYLQIKKQIDSAVTGVLESGWYILGKELQSFESEFARYLEVPYCVGVASGTEAIALSLMALGIGKGDEVIAPCFTAFPTITGIMQAGALPVLVDVNPEDALMNVNLILKAITEKTRAIIPVHLYGQSCEMESLAEIAKGCNLHVIEDCAQSAGATCHGRKTGWYGDCSAFSFYPTKNLGALGDAGAVVTHSKNLYEKLLALRNYGQSDRYYHDSEGINSRMDEIQAAVLRVKLKSLDIWNERRRTLAALYRNNLKNFGLIRENGYGTPCYHLFVIKHPERDTLLSFLDQRGIKALIHYPVPVNRQKAFRWQRDEIFAATEDLASTVLSIPVYPELSDKDAEYIISTLHEFRTWNPGIHRHPGLQQ